MNRRRRDEVAGAAEVGTAEVEMTPEKRSAGTAVAGAGGGGGAGGRRSRWKRRRWKSPDRRRWEKEQREVEGDDLYVLCVFDMCVVCLGYLKGTSVICVSRS